jgi:hypothetical protein
LKIVLDFLAMIRYCLITGAESAEDDAQKRGTKMDAEILEWALKQSNKCCAGIYARDMAEYIKTIGDIEADYPNWQEKFHTIADAVHFHTISQQNVINNLRRTISALQEK